MVSRHVSSFSVYGLRLSVVPLGLLRMSDYQWWVDTLHLCPPMSPLPTICHDVHPSCFQTLPVLNHMGTACPLFFIYAKRDKPSLLLCPYQSDGLLSQAFFIHCGTQSELSLLGKKISIQSSKKKILRFLIVEKLYSEKWMPSNWHMRVRV